MLADFSQVSYIDSPGIGCLIGIYTSILKNASGRFVLANLNRRVRDVLELTRLANVIPIYPSEDAALAALEAARNLQPARYPSAIRKSGDSHHFSRTEPLIPP